MVTHLRKPFLFIMAGLAALAVFFVFAVNSQAQEIDKERALQIVAEKGGPGGCDSEASCAEFCDANIDVCMNWARDNGVISNDEFKKQSEFVQQGGPGGCRTPKECKTYCDNETNFDECIEFGQRQGLISEEQAQRARRTGPGGCKTQRECNAFCKQPQNHDVCIDHAVQEGFMTREEAQRIKEFRKREEEFRRRVDEFSQQRRGERGPRHEGPEGIDTDLGFDENKALRVIESQGGPGGCKTFQECERFCDNPDNESACFEFAERHELFTKKENVAKIKKLITEGGPGGCRGEPACKQFCENETNFEVCISFAEKHGLMPPEEIERAKRGIEAFKGEGGPAGCSGPKDCEEVCRNPANQNACFEWAKRHGLISKEELRFHEEFQKIRQEFESRRQKFEEEHRDDFRPGDMPHNFGPPREEFRGPGGCQGPAECEKYCQEHPEECGRFGPQEKHRPSPPHEEFRPEEFNHPDEFAPNEFEPKRSDPATECAEHGGIWTGTTCEFPRQQEEFRPPEEFHQPDGSFNPDESFSEPKFSEPKFEEFHETEQEPTSLRDHRFLGAISRFLFR